MPLYEFCCHNCGHKCEELCGSSVKSIKCPRCGSEAPRIISSFRTGRSASGGSSSASSCGG